MEKVYADLIRKGKKSLNDVPARLQSAVKALLDGPTDEQDVGLSAKNFTLEGGGRNGCCICNPNR